MGQAQTPWSVIRRSMEVRGLWNADGISRKARARYCRHCPAVVIAGLDHERSAAAAYVEPRPVNPMGEAVALLHSRRTYSLRWTIDHYELDLRWAESITAHPAGSQANVDIVVAHQCFAEPFAENLHTTPNPRPAQLLGDDLDCPPPF